MLTPLEFASTSFNIRLARCCAPRLAANWGHILTDRASGRNCSANLAEQREQMALLRESLWHAMVAHR
jgi:hypothetical protein